MSQDLPVPDLSDSRILRAVCGIRPCRTGGLRLEADESGLGGLPLIHNYGHGGCGVTLGWGCAQHAADLVDNALDLNDIPLSTPKESRHTLVLGAGVIGLTTAHELLLRGHRVTVLAKAFATDTTSNLAGALWLPTGIDFPEPGSARDTFNQILRDSYARFETLRAHPGGGERWGVESLPVYEPETMEYVPEHFESGAIDKPTDLDRLPFPGEPMKGRVFHTLFIHTPRFLNVLRGEVEHHGGRLITKAIDSMNHATSLAQDHQADAMVNCMGLGATDLVSDPALYPARGVLLHMQPTKLGYAFHNGYNYVFPRADALILGGCYQPGRTDTEPDQEMIDDILAKQRAIFEPMREAIEKQQPH